MTKPPNHFQLFEIPVSFDVDLAELTLRYQVLQKTVHPDKFANASEQEKLLAVQRAAQVNEGYGVLKTPLARAKYLLSLNEVTPDDNATISDPGFLMQQMEMRESLEAANQQANALVAVENVLDEIDGNHQHLLDEIKQRFDTVSPDYLLINECVLKLNFYNRLKDEAENLLANIENDANE